MDGVATAMGDIAIVDATPMASAASVAIRPRDTVDPSWIEVWVTPCRLGHYRTGCVTSHRVYWRRLFISRTYVVDPTTSRQAPHNAPERGQYLR